MRIGGTCHHSIDVKEELGNFYVKILKTNKKRSNITLFMILSIVRLSNNDFKKVVWFF